MDDQYFALAYRGEARCPVFLNGVLHEEFAEGAFDRPMTYGWQHDAPGEGPPDDLPAELWLVTKDRSYGFDFHTAFGGHVVSAGFLELLRAGDTGDWQVSRLQVVSAKGRPIPAKEYSFVRFPRSALLSTERLVDPERSRIDLRRDGQVKKVWELRFAESPERDFFLLDSVALSGVAFCSRRFAEAAERLGPKGVEFVPLPGIGSLQSA
ncbi:Imm43 family immunity protein [Kitasatospora sp. NPDC101176]|uniref:Imm43 family immunity protein n=1 Tax=Kitasatospora sp. NPDC101176 TaxID=3364099 RepID=UPI00380FECE0